jgi:PAS domain S-box-containing protein
MLQGRALARAAIGGLAIGLVVLAGLAVWSTASTRRATAHVRELNMVSDAWGGFAQQVTIVEDATKAYLDVGSELGPKPLALAISQETSDLRWIERHGDADDVRSAQLTENVYATYLDTLREMMAARAHGDAVVAAEQADQAELVVASLRRQVAVGMDRTRLATTAYLDEVDRANQALALRAEVSAGADFALLLLCSVVLLGYQRRVERHAARSRAERDKVVAFAAATNRDAVIQAGLTAAVAMGANVGGAGVAISTGSTLALSGTGGWAAGGNAGPPVEIADLPETVPAALTSGDCMVLTEEDGAELARALRLTHRSRFILAPLVVRQEAIGLLILGLDSRPSPELSAAAATLAYEIGFTLDRLQISERLRVIVEHSSDLLFLTSENTTIGFANPAAEAAVGQPTSALVGADLRSLIHPDDRAETLTHIDAPGGRTTEACRLRRGDGEWMQVEMIIGQVQEHDGSASLVVNARDMSERHRLEVELRHAQKLESVGRLAAGIAHEINTPVQFIGDNVRFLESSFADLLRLREAHGTVLSAIADPAAVAAAVDAVRELETDLDVDFVAEEVPAAIKQTLDGVDRVATIVRAMKAFGYTSNDEKAPADLNEAIGNTLVVADSELKYVADVETDFAELPPVWCHIGDVNQVVLNLVVNAAHAVAAAGKERGTVRVSTRVDADQAVIEVTDSGTGIPPEIADKVFEAFFTTKDVGAGTGQGLALCWSLVVDRHGGAIDFTSEPGAGTTFTVRLPIAASNDPEPGEVNTDRVDATT